MGLANVLPDDARGIDRLESVATRLEDGTEAVSATSTRVRRAAGERAAAAVDRGADELRNRSGSDGEFRDRVLERVADEACRRVFGRSAGDLRKQAKADRDAALDRALEAFLRRYRLDATRLDDETLAAIRDRVAPEADLAPEQLLERLAGASDESASKPGSQADPTDATAAVADAYAQFCATLDLETDRSPDRVLEDVLRRDAVDVAWALERALDEFPTVPKESRAGSEPTAGRTRGQDAEPTVSPEPGLAVGSEGADLDAIAGSASATTAAAVAATSL
jgi:nitric oxide reductase subunit B